MIIEQEEFQKKLKRINLAYFSDPDRIITISKGNAARGNRIKGFT